MDRKAGLMVAVALLLGTGLSPALPGLAGVAGAADEAQGAATFAGSSTESDELFHVEWRSGRVGLADPELPGMCTTPMGGRRGACSSGSATLTLPARRSQA